MKLRWVMTHGLKNAVSEVVGAESSACDTRDYADG